MVNGKWGAATTKTFWLSMHVPYACRDSGECCSSRWPIPLERSRVEALRLLRTDRTWLVPVAEAPSDVAGVLAVFDNGHCVFHHDGCEIQRVLGPAAMPDACQHFPREVLIDRRGVFVTLSHYCPTAADLLFQHSGVVEIVEGPPAIPHGAPEGLDARGVLPPLLTDDVLMDYEGYSAWETHTVRVLTRDDGQTPEEALSELWHDLAIVQRWRPGRISLAAEIARLPPPLISTSVPKPTYVPNATSVPTDVVIRRYLSARAFASWMAYQGGGIAAVLGSIALALSVLRNHIARITARDAAPLNEARLKEAIRASDRWLVHETPRAQLVAEIKQHQISNSATTGP